MAKELMEKLSQQNYYEFLKLKPTERAHFIQSDISNWGLNGILKFLQMMGTSTMVFIATITMMYILPLQGLIGIILIMSCSVIVILLTKKKILTSSIKMRDNNASGLSALIFFRTIKEIKINNKENFFINNFLKKYKQFGFNNAQLFFSKSTSSNNNDLWSDGYNNKCYCIMV